MRKLRDNIALKEGIDYAELLSANMTPGERYCLLKHVAEQREYVPRFNQDPLCYPDSFYEQPPIGSFGKFWNGPEPCNPSWGYLEQHQSASWKKLGEMMWYHHFEPGLPTDVDEQGWPK